MRKTFFLCILLILVQIAFAARPNLNKTESQRIADNNLIEAVKTLDPNGVEHALKDSANPNVSINAKKRLFAH